MDDYEYVRNDPMVRQGLTEASIRSAFYLKERDFWIPLTRLSYMVDIEVHGFSPRGFRLTNILIHAAGMGILLLLLWKMTGSLGACVVASALVALHPMRVESVVWITERKDVLAIFFFLLAAAAYVGYTRAARRFGWYAVSLVFLSLSLMSKPMLVTFPVLMLLLDFWPLDRISGLKADVGRPRWEALKPFVLEKIPFFILSAAAGILTIVAQNQKGALHPISGPHPLLLRAQNFLFATFIYLRKTFWPLDMAIDVQESTGGRVQPWLLLLAAAAFLAATWAAIRVSRRWPFVTVGWLWYLVAIFPVSGILPAGKQWIADRFTYLPHMGLAVVLAWGLGRMASRGNWGKVLVSATGLAALTALTLLTFRQIGYWERSSVILERSVALSPHKAELRNMLGSSLMDDGRWAMAEEQFRIGTILEPRSSNLRFNYAIALKNMGRLSEAVAQFAEAVRLDPKDDLARLYLQAMEVEETRPDLAAAIYSNYLQQIYPLSPSFAMIQGHLGLALARMGDIPGAEENLRSAVMLIPDNLNAHYNLAIILANQGKTEEAVFHYKEALKLWPGDLQARLNLAELFFSEGYLHEAENHFQAVASKVPGSAEARFSQGRILQMRGDVDGAMTEYSAGLSAPGSTQVRAVLRGALDSLARTGPRGRSSPGNRPGS